MQGFVASFAGRAGAALAPIIMATILMGYFGLGWRTAIIIMAAIGLILAVAFYLYYRNDPKSDGRVDDAEKTLLMEDKDPGKSQRQGHELQGGDEESQPGHDGDSPSVECRSGYCVHDGAG